MATHNQYYRAGKRKAAKKMTGEQRRKLNEARRLIALQDGYVPKVSVCRKCAYYFQHNCSFDGSSNPVKTECVNFARKPH